MQRLISSLYMFFNGARLAYIALFVWATPRGYFYAKILAPLTQLLFCVYLGMAATGKGTANFYLVGDAMLMSSINGIYGMTMVIGLERDNGTLIYLLGSPTNRNMLLLGRAFFNVLDGALLVLICLLCGTLLGLNLSAANFPGLALTILTVSISVCGLGILLGSICLMLLNVMFVNNTIFFLLLIFSGANIRLSQLPAWMQAIGEILPLTHGIQAARLFASGSSFAAVWPLLAEECIVGSIYIMLGFVVFRWFELSAKQKGTLEAF